MELNPNETLECKRLLAKANGLVREAGEDFASIGPDEMVKRNIQNAIHSLNQFLRVVQH